MTSLSSVLRCVAQDLKDISARWALVGGLAVSARSNPRFTNDIDLALATAGDIEAEAVVHELLGRGYRVLACLENRRAGRLATIRLLPPGQDEDGIIVDLLFASSGIEPELSGQATLVEVLPELELPVAALGHLVALKVLAMDDARRPLDRLDLLAMLEQIDPTEMARARAALALIRERGFDRGKDLEKILASLLEDFRS